MNGRISAQSVPLSELFSAPRVAANFVLHKGALLNVDLVHALQSVGRNGQRGGRSAFDEISGELQVASNHTSYRRLTLVSGPIVSSGALDVSPASRLSGRLSTTLSSKAGTIARNELTLAGGVQDPLLLP